MSNQETQAFWTQPRTVFPTWRHRVESWLNKLYDAYTALWDLMPAIAAFAALLWFINLIS